MKMRLIPFQICLALLLLFAAAGTPVRGAGNLLENGDFEAGPGLTGWSEDYWQQGSTLTEPLNGKKDWTYVELNFRTHATQTNVTAGARLGMYSNDTTGTAYFADLALVQLNTAPASYVQLSAPNGDGTGGGKGPSLWFILILAYGVIVAANVFFRMKRQQAAVDTGSRKEVESADTGWAKPEESASSEGEPGDGW